MRMCREYLSLNFYGENILKLCYKVTKLCCSSWLLGRSMSSCQASIEMYLKCFVFIVASQQNNALIYVQFNNELK